MPMSLMNGFAMDPPTWWDRTRRGDTRPAPPPLRNDEARAGRRVLSAYAEPVDAGRTGGGNRNLPHGGRRGPDGERGRPASPPLGDEPPKPCRRWGRAGPREGGRRGRPRRGTSAPPPTGPPARR